MAAPAANRELSPVGKVLNAEHHDGNRKKDPSDGLQINHNVVRGKDFSA
jgi:hypothetical protein